MVYINQKSKTNSINSVWLKLTESTWTIVLFTDKLDRKTEFNILLCLQCPADFELVKLSFIEIYAKQPPVSCCSSRKLLLEVFQEHPAEGDDDFSKEL